jgi:hypothetical protein
LSGGIFRQQAEAGQATFWRYGKRAAAAVPDRRAHGGGHNAAFASGQAPKDRSTLYFNAE